MIPPPLKSSITGSVDVIIIKRFADKNAICKSGKASHCFLLNILVDNVKVIALCIYIGTINAVKQDMEYVSL